VTEPEPYLKNLKHEQMTDFYGVPCDVQHVRTFRNKREMGVGYPLSKAGTWFVYDRDSADDLWHMHCGPYSTFDQGEYWINSIRDDSRAIEPCSNCHGTGSMPDMSCCPKCGGGGKVLGSD
jgi:hypothetical protein